MRIDGAAAKSQAALAEHISLVWLTPQMDRLFLEGSARPAALPRPAGLRLRSRPCGARSEAYEQAMRERARLLRDGPADPAWLAALESRMAEHGVAVAAARREVTARLDAACRQSRGPFPRRAAGSDGRGRAAGWKSCRRSPRRRSCSGGSRPGGALDAESGTTLVGPHRGDLAVRHAGTGMPAAQCSTGEQKALLVAVLLAQARLQASLRGAAPLMLLDEVAAHLDAERRAALFDEIVGLGAQAWLTGTDRALFAALERPGAIFRRG